VKRDSGLLNNVRIHQDIKYLERTLTELEEKNVLYGFEKGGKAGETESR
jgi:hypothetical protein